MLVQKLLNMCLASCTTKQNCPLAGQYSECGIHPKSGVVRVEKIKQKSFFCILFDQNISIFCTGQTYLDSSLPKISCVLA